MKQRGQLFEEMECITSLTEKAMPESRLKGTFISVSILQLSILWQMYAVAKLPGHSDKTENYFRQIIVMQKENNITFVKSFSRCNLSSGSSVEKSLVENYLFCFGCDSREKHSLSCKSSTPKRSEIIKSTGRKKLNLLWLVVVPLLEHYLRKSLDWLKANPEQKLINVSIYMHDIAYGSMNFKATHICEVGDNSDYAIPICLLNIEY